MMKIKRLADPELENSFALLDKLDEGDVNFKNLFRLLFEYQIFEDPKGSLTEVWWNFSGHNQEFKDEKQWKNQLPNFILALPRIN